MFALDHGTTKAMSAHTSWLTCVHVSQVIMGGDHWERRRERANAAFQALNSYSDPQDAIQPWDSISNVVPQSVVTVTSCVPVPPKSRPGTFGVRAPPPREGPSRRGGGTYAAPPRCAAVLE